MRDLALAFQVRSVGDTPQVKGCWDWLRTLDKCEADELHLLLLEEKALYEGSALDYFEAGADCIAWMAEHGGGQRVWEVLYPRASPS